MPLSAGHNSAYLSVVTRNDCASAGSAPDASELPSPVSTELAAMLCQLEVVRRNLLEKFLPDEDLKVATASNVVFVAADHHVVVASAVASLGKAGDAAALDDPLEQGLLRRVQHRSKLTATAACCLASDD